MSQKRRRVSASLLQKQASITTSTTTATEKHAIRVQFRVLAGLGAVLPPPTTSHPPSRKEVAVLRGSGEPDLKEGVQLIKEECDELLKSAWYPRAEIMEVKHRMSKAYGGLAKNFTADDFHGVGDANELKRQILSVDRTLPALDYLRGGGSGLGR